MKDSTPDWIITGLIAGAAFLVTFVIADIGIAVSLLITALAFAGGSLLFRRRPTDRSARDYRQNRGGVQIGGEDPRGDPARPR